MGDEKKTRAELLKELETLRGRLAELERAEANRKRKEEKLRVSEETHQIVTEHATDIVYQHDLPGNIKLLSPSCEPLTGYSVEEGISMNIRDVLTPDSYALASRLIRDRLNSDEERQGEYYPPILADLEVVRKDGSTFWAEITARFLRDKDDNPIGVTGILRDVDERKRAQEALQESETTLKSIFRAAPIGIGMVCNRIIKQANDRLCEMLGYAREELLDQSARILYPTKEDFDFVGREKFAQIRERGTGSVETRWQRKDGEVIDVLLSSSPLDPDNLSTGLIFTALNVTQQKWAEEELQQKMIELSSFINNIPDMAWLKDTESRFIAVNKAFGESVGMDPESLANQTCVVCFGEEEGKRFQEDDRKVIESEKQRVIEEKIVDSQGDGVWLETIKSPILDETGTVKGTVGIARDITQRKQMEEALRESEAKLRVQARHLEEVNAALKVLLTRREDDKIELAESVQVNVKELLLPYLEKLKKSDLGPHQMTQIEIVEAHLKEIVSPFTSKLSSRFLKLTSTEIKLANLIREGRTTKEIAELLGLSENTIQVHRHHIRSKLGLKHKGINLRSYLRSLD